MIWAVVLVLFIFARAPFFLFIYFFQGEDETFQLRVHFKNLVWQINIVRICLVYFNVLKSSHKPNKTFEMNCIFFKTDSFNLCFRVILIYYKLLCLLVSVKNQLKEFTLLAF